MKGMERELVQLRSKVTTGAATVRPSTSTGRPAGKPPVRVVKQRSQGPCGNGGSGIIVDAVEDANVLLT